MDKYQAHWVSHSSISDFLHCPRAYFLRAVYKDPKTGHKITQTKPSLSLGQVVHDVLDEISYLPVGERFNTPLAKRLEVNWKKVEGELGGFVTSEIESEYKQKAIAILDKLEKDPGPLTKKAVKLKSEDGLPYYWLSEEENIILCGKIDWIEYLEKSDSVHIIDFKTGKSKEEDSSLQLPIYVLLVANLQPRKISRVSYWYLNASDRPHEVPLPDTNEALNKVFEVARRMKMGKQINYFKCPKGGCFFCTPLERILKCEGKLVGVSQYRQDVYLLPS